MLWVIIDRDGIILDWSECFGWSPALLITEPLRAVSWRQSDSHMRSGSHHFTVRVLSLANDCVMTAMLPSIPFLCTSAERHCLGASLKVRCMSIDTGMHLQCCMIVLRSRPIWSVLWKVGRAAGLFSSFQSLVAADGIPTKWLAKQQNRLIDRDHRTVFVQHCHFARANIPTWPWLRRLAYSIWAWWSLSSPRRPFLQNPHGIIAQPQTPQSVLEDFHIWMSTFLPSRGD